MDLEFVTFIQLTGFCPFYSDSYTHTFRTIDKRNTENIYLICLIDVLIKVHAWNFFTVKGGSLML